MLRFIYRLQFNFHRSVFIWHLVCPVLELFYWRSVQYSHTQDPGVAMKIWMTNKQLITPPIVNVDENLQLQLVNVLYKKSYAPVNHK